MNTRVFVAAVLALMVLSVIVYLERWRNAELRYLNRRVDELATRRPSRAKGGTDVV